MSEGEGYLKLNEDRADNGDRLDLFVMGISRPKFTKFRPLSESAQRQDLAQRKEKTPGGLRRA